MWWPSWAPHPNEPYSFCGHQAILNHAHALVTVCPYYVNLTSKDIKLHIISSSSCRVMIWATAKGKQNPIKTKYLKNKKKGEEERFLLLMLQNLQESVVFADWVQGLILLVFKENLQQRKMFRTATSVWKAPANCINPPLMTAQLKRTGYHSTRRFIQIFKWNHNCTILHHNNASNSTPWSGT